MKYVALYHITLPEQLCMNTILSDDSIHIEIHKSVNIKIEIKYILFSAGTSKTLFCFLTVLQCCLLLIYELQTCNIGLCRSVHNCIL